MSWITDNVFEFRPYSPLVDMYRYNEGNWIPDDGEYDIAFISGPKSVGAPYALYVELPTYPNLLWSYAYRGNWGANIYEHPNNNAWHYMTTDGKPWSGYWKKSSHPNDVVHDVACNKVNELHRCANGRSVQFHLDDEVIKAGLLRIKDTEEVVKFPDIFECCHCGDIDWRKLEAMPKEQFWDWYSLQSHKKSLEKVEAEYKVKYGRDGLQEE